LISVCHHVNILFVLSLSSLCKYDTGMKLTKSLLGSGWI